MLNLRLRARPDERFHLQHGPPVPHVSRSWFYTVVIWTNIFLPDGTPGRFVSWWLIGHAIHWYTGNVKIDGSRTEAYWAGQLDDGQEPHYMPDMTKFVATTTQKEMFSVRFFVDQGEPMWSNMGGA